MSGRGRRLRLTGFVLVHALIAGSGLTWGHARFEARQAAQELPPLRNKPLRVLPQRNVPEVVSNGQLQRVLHKLRPRLRGENPRINHVDHALRFWGTEATFDDANCLSGRDMRRLLLDHRRFDEAWEDGTRPFLTETRYGVRPRLRRGPATASHEEHTLAGLAEVGTPLDHPVVTPDRETTLRAILEDALKSFSLNQPEYEWSALAFALYMPTDESWMTTEGQWISFDRLAERIMRERLRRGVCYGNHRLHALVMLLRVDERVPMLSAPMRRKVVGHLRDVLQTLVETQSDDGYWGRAWDGTEVTETSPGGNELRRRRILATGHALEWLALAPDEIQPPRRMVVDAGQWLCRTIESMSGEDIADGYTFLSHAGRALALWRGRLPADVNLERIDSE